MLSHRDKENLYAIITAAIGEDASIRSYKNSFNEETVLTVEKMIEQSIKCNSTMKELIKNLLGGSANITRGWLKKFLKTSKKITSVSEFKGYGCLVSVKSKWKSAIILSTLQ